jgi:hypothetical protein
VGIGKDSHLSSLNNWIGSNSFPVCADESPFNVWSDWGAGQRDMFVTDLSGNVVLQQNITSGVPDNLESILVTLATSTNGPELCELGDVYVSEAHNSGDPEDYIEIYNSGSEECSLEGFQLDDSSVLDDFTFGDVTIPAGGYWVGYEDEDGSFTSGLNTSGDSIVFADPNDNSLFIELLPLQELGNTLLSQSFESDGNGCYTNPTPGFINSDCITLSADVIKSVPAKYALNQNYPNPFNPITRITYSISNNEYIDIYITDLNGSNIKYLFKGNVLSGSHSIIWDGTDDSSNDMPSGVYFLTLKSSTFNQTIKMMYLK